jgi:membrane-bound lytic murein transglycosylase C
MEMNVMIASLVSLLILTHTGVARSQPQSEFEAYMAQQQRGAAAVKDEFETYKQQLLKAFDDYKRQSGAIWGKKHTVMPQANNWVSYHNNLGQRSVVDFEQGTITVEIAVPAQQNISAAEAQQRLQNTILKTLNQGTDPRSMIEISQQPVAVSSGPAVLDGMVANTNGSEANKQDYTALASAGAMQATTENIRGEDGTKRVVYRTELKMVPDHIRKRASQFLNDVNAQSQRQSLPPSLIFAVMETESYFNPAAKSSAPAFGLMQLVPTSGAREAYRYVYNQDRVVNDTYLYEPKNNIELGTAYLNRLYYLHLADIQNPHSRMWCAIAGYNTGPSNVLRAFGGKYSKAQHGNYDNWKKSAIAQINRMSADDVYMHLRGNLPYVETRDYVKKVGERMGKYESI